MSSLVVEENGKFSVSQSPRESVSSAASSQIDRSKKNDVNPDYRSPYALSDDQKKRLRKRERAKQRKLREDAEAERIQKQEIEVTSFFKMSLTIEGLKDAFNSAGNPVSRNAFLSCEIVSLLSTNKK